MNWKNFWQHMGNQQNPLLQVGRKVGEFLQNEKELEDYAAYIASTLALTQDDVLLDVCCGNGLLTAYLSKYCKTVVGVDFSQTHIDYANLHYASPTVTYQCVDALALENIKLQNQPFGLGFSKSTLCFSFQYFETIQLGSTVINGIFNQGVKQLFITDIPNKDKFWVYYNTPLKWGKLFKQMVFNQNDMGKFWSEKELRKIADTLHLKGENIIHPIHFPYSHYRMGFMLKISE